MIPFCHRVSRLYTYYLLYMVSVAICSVGNSNSQRERCSSRWKLVAFECFWITTRLLPTSVSTPDRLIIYYTRVVYRFSRDMTTKPRIFRQCVDIIYDYESVNRNKDLVHLSRKFDEYKKHLRALIEALEEQHDAALKMNHAKMKVAKSLSSLCDQSPIADLVGTMQAAQDAEPSKSLMESAMKKFISSSNDKRLSEHSHSSSSYLSVHRKLFLQRKLYLDFLDEFIIDYLKEIERVEVNRVQKGLQQSEILRRDLDHYFYKVPSIEKQCTRSKGNNQSLVQCLKRNEKKLKNAKRAYDDHTQDLCLLLDEITERGWRDFFPIIMKLNQSDIFNSAFESESVNELIDVVEKLKAIGERYQVKMDSRAPELKLSTPIELSTRHLGTMGSGISVDTTEVVDEKSPKVSDDADEWEDESFVKAAMEATHRAELYQASLQSYEKPENEDSKEPDIIVSPQTTTTDQPEPDVIVSPPTSTSVKEEKEEAAESGNRGEKFVDVGIIHLAPAPTEAD